MRRSTIALGGLALALTAIAPAQAQTRVVHETKTTTVTKVHGPLHILPHHKNKICKTRWVHHHRVQKCYYH